MVCLVFVCSFWCPVIWILCFCLYFLRRLFWVSFSVLCWSFVPVQIAFVHLKSLSCTISIIFTVLHFVIFCLSLVVVCYVLTVVCHTAVNNLFGLPLKLSSLQLLNKVSWNTPSSNRMISTDRSVSGYILQPGKPFVPALFTFRVQIFYANINILFTKIFVYRSLLGSDGFDL